MNEKLGSEFLTDFELATDSFLFGFSKRHIILFLGIILGGFVTVAVLLLELFESIYVLFDICFVTPMIFYGVSADEKLHIKDKLYFALLITNRIYQTQLDDIGGD